MYNHCKYEPFMFFLMEVVTFKVSNLEVKTTLVFAQILTNYNALMLMNDAWIITVAS